MRFAAMASDTLASRVLPHVGGGGLADLFHGSNERIPVDGFLWGLRVLYRIVRDFCT